MKLSPLDKQWEEFARKEIDNSRSELRPEEQDQFKNWLRDHPDSPASRWKTNENAYCDIDLTDILGRVDYCHDFVRDALRFYLYHLTHSDGEERKYEDNASGLARLINLVYYTEKREGRGEEILNEILEAVISALSKYPRWIKVDLLTKVLCFGCPIYVAVRLFNGFESPSEPLPRALLQSAAFTKDHFYFDPIREGYSVATRIMGWGSNRLSNLGCHEGSSVDQRSMVTLPKFGGARVTAFSVGVNHSLFFTENRQLFVTGRLKNWTGRSDDERIALTPFQVDLPPRAKQLLHSKKFQCRRVYAGANRSEIFLSTDGNSKKTVDRRNEVYIIAGPSPKGTSKDPAVVERTVILSKNQGTTESEHTLTKEDRLHASEPSHFITNNGGGLEPETIRFKGSKKNKLDISISVNYHGDFLVSDSSKSLAREMRICVGNVMHRPHSFRQTAFCDNGDVYCLMQMDRMARNSTLVKGEIRRLRVDQMEWTSKKAGRERNDEQYYLVAEQIPGAEHVVQFSVDRNGENLLFEIRDQPWADSFCPLSSPTSSTFNSHEDPEVCYGGATRDLELLQRERECGNVMVEEKELISLYPHSNLQCPRLFLREELVEELKVKEPIVQRNMEKGVSKNLTKNSAPVRNRVRSRQQFVEKLLNDSLEWDGFSYGPSSMVLPFSNQLYGASLSSGSLALAVPRFETRIDMRTKEYEDEELEDSMESISLFIEDIFPSSLYPNGVKASITGRSDAFYFVTIRPETPSTNPNDLRMLRVTYNGEREFEIAANLWELHTPHFNRSLFHSSAMAPVVECPFPESLMRMCERAFIDPSSTENYTTIQLLNMLDVADYLCANLLAEDVIYRLLRNASRLDINETLAEIVQTLNSRPSLVSVLSRFPHILLDWPLDLEADMVYEACERMQMNVGPVGVGGLDRSLLPVPTHSNLSLFILASPNCELSVGMNELPLSNELDKASATTNIFQNRRSEDTLLNLIEREDLHSLLFDSFKGEKGIIEKSKKIFEQSTRNENGCHVIWMDELVPTISDRLEEFLTRVPSPEPTPTPIPKEKPSARRTRRHTERKSEREGREERRSEEKKEEKMEVEEKVEEVVERVKEVSINNNHSPPVERRREEVENRLPPRPFAEILKEEEEREAAKKASTPKRAEGRDGGKRSKFRPLSFSDSGPSTSSKNVDKKHDWTQSPRQEPPKEKQAKSFNEIMKEQSEKKAGVSRRRGPSVSGCQMEAEAIEALREYYGHLIENHQLVSVEVCRNEEEEPRWNADADLYLE